MHGWKEHEGERSIEILKIFLSIFFINCKHTASMKMDRSFTFLLIVDKKCS
jgi:hypothetical protein